MEAEFLEKMKQKEWIIVQQARKIEKLKEELWTEKGIIWFPSTPVEEIYRKRDIKQSQKKHCKIEKQRHKESIAENSIK